MTKAGEAQRMAETAAERLERAREVGSQLDLFGPPAAPGEGGDQDDGQRGPGRPPGSRNRVKAGLRELMFAQGWRDPAQQLAYLAGLNSREDPYLVAIGRAQAILAASGASEHVSRKRLPEMVQAILREMRQAADAIMPYVFGKVTPDVVDQRQQMVVQMMVGTGGEGAARAIGARIGPPPMPSEFPEGNQGLGEAARPQSDGEQSDGRAE